VTTRSALMLAAPALAGLARVALMTGCADETGPRLDRAEPAAAGHGAMVTLTGRRLCGKTGDCATAGGQVQIGLDLPTVRANVVEYEDTRAVVVVPDVAPVGRTELVVTVNEQASNALAFEVLAP
jgi:hypothetical protein